MTTCENCKAEGEAFCFPLPPTESVEVCRACARGWLAPQALESLANLKASIADLAAEEQVQRGLLKAILSGTGGGHVSGSGLKAEYQEQHPLEIDEDQVREDLSPDEWAKVTDEKLNRSKLVKLLKGRGGIKGVSYGTQFVLIVKEEK